MTEVTQEDRDLGNELWKMSVNWGNREDMEDMIAAHREAAFEAGRLAERKAVVGWLRDQDGHGEWREAADAITAEFLQENPDD